MNISKQTSSSDWEKIIIQLREIAEQKNITQEEIADKTGMIQSAISRVFSLKWIPKLATVLLIAKALDVELKIVDKMK